MESFLDLNRMKMEEIVSKFNDDCATTFANASLSANGRMRV